MKKLIAVIGLLLLAGCDDATIASHNLSKAADNFEIARRVVFYNGITDSYMLEIVGLCSIDVGNGDALTKKAAVTCKTGPNEYKKHYLMMSDNTTLFAEQLDSANVSTYRYRVTFKPSVILSDVRVK